MHVAVAGSGAGGGDTIGGAGERPGSGGGGGRAGNGASTKGGDGGDGGDGGFGGDGGGDGGENTGSIAYTFQNDAKPPAGAPEHTLNI